MIGQSLFSLMLKQVQDLHHSCFNLPFLKQRKQMEIVSVIYSISRHKNQVIAGLHEILEILRRDTDNVIRSCFSGMIYLLH